MRKKTKKTLGIAGVVLAVGLMIYFFGFSNLFSIAFEEGYLPYGESTNQITGLNLISTIPGNEGYEIRNYDSQYWDITTSINPSQNGIGTGNYEVLGNDFDIFVHHNSCSTSHSFLTKEYFDDKTFKTDIMTQWGGAENPAGGGGYSVSVYAVKDTTSIKLFDYASPGGSTGNYDDLLMIEPSPITDNVFVYWNGREVKEILIEGRFKIRFDVSLSKPRTSGRSCTASTDGFSRLEIKNPSYKSDFGCTTEPGEQTYIRIYKEGQIVDINDFNNFQKFCLEESPLKIYQNSGIGTDKSILGSLFEGETFTVPTGQIWSIEYIGQKSIFQTECEAGEVYVENQNECLARTIVSFECPEGSLDLETGLCIVETIPTPYEDTSISTHQTLLENSQFRFTDIFQNNIRENPTSIKIFDSNFIMGGVSYVGNDISKENIHYEDDPQNWIASFSYGNQQFSGTLNQEFILNERLKVKITNIDGIYDNNLKTPGSSQLERYRVDYTFDLDTDFLNLSYEPGTIIVQNDFKTFTGGLTITKTDKLGLTTIGNIERILPVGENKISIDVQGLEEIKVRPYLTIESSNFVYNLDTSEALIIKNPEEPENTIVIPVLDKEVSILKFVLIIIGLILLIIVLIWIAKKR